MYNLIFLLEVEYSNMANARFVMFPCLESCCTAFLGGLLDTQDYWTSFIEKTE